MRRLIPLLIMLAALGPPVFAISFYISPDVPTTLGGTTYQPWEIVRNDSGAYSLKLALPANTPIGGIHQMCSGKWLLSVEAPTTLGGTTYDPRDVIVYDPVAGVFAGFFNGAAAGVPQGSHVDALFLDGGDTANLVVSFDVPTTIGAATYEPADLVRYAAGAFTLFFDASATVPPVPVTSDVIGADRAGTKTVLAFDVPTTLGPPTYLPGQLVSWTGGAYAVFYADPGWPISSQDAGFSFLPDPGRVPPPTLLVNKSSLVPGSLSLIWGAATSAGAEDYGIYEGLIGSWYSHAAIDCNDASADRVEDVTPAAGNRYYLVVPLNSNDEGSYGLTSSGVERPVGAPACRATQALDCP